MGFGSNLRYFRETQNMSQEDLGKKLSVDPQMIQLWEDERSAPDENQLQCLKELFTVSLEDLYTERSPENRPKERLVFTRSLEEYRCFVRQVFFPIRTRIFACFTAALLMLLLMCLLRYEILSVVLAVLLTLWQLANLCNMIRAEKRSLEKYREQERGLRHVYEFYVDRILIKDWSAGEYRDCDTVKKDEIVDLRSTASRYIFKTSLIWSSVDKPLLSEASFVHSFFETDIRRSKSRPWFLRVLADVMLFVCLGLLLSLPKLQELFWYGSLGLAGLKAIYLVTFALPFLIVAIALYAREKRGSILSYLYVASLSLAVLLYDAYHFFSYINTIAPLG